jgi:hypothetical protein
MIITIALGIVLAIILIALLPVIFQAFSWVIGAGFIFFIGYILFEGTDNAKLIVWILILVLVGSLLAGVLFGLIEKFYNSKSIFKFLAIKITNPAFSDKQKINQIKKLSELDKQIDKKKEQSKQKAKINKYRKAEKNFHKLKINLDKLLKYYLKNDYISLNFSPPTLEANTGRIFINSKVNKSIIKLANNHHDWEKYGKDVFKVERDPVDGNQYMDKDYFYGNSKFVTKQAKRFLIEYFKLHSEELK